MLPLQKNKITTLLWLCLLTGTLDGIAALLLSYKISPAVVFEYIASGWFGKAAFSGGAAMVIWGVLFHYLIASFYSILFFLLYPAVITILKNKYVAATVFGFTIWLIMNLVILPLTNVPKHAGNINITGAIISIVVLIICLGIPIAFIANKHKKNNPV